MLKILLENSQKLEHILATFVEPTLDHFLLEKPLVKEFSELSNTTTIAHCLKEMRLYSLILKKYGGQHPTIIHSESLQRTSTDTSGGKREESVKQPPSNSNLMNLIIWNTRGANSEIFRRQCDAIIKTNKLTMLVLLETKMDEHKALTQALNFDACIQFSASGMKGRIMVMWKEDSLKLDNISISIQGIHVMVKILNDVAECSNVGVYL
ncbi:hypothetical protein P3L10_034369 [Capsicum annuum]